MSLKSKFKNLLIGIFLALPFAILYLPVLFGNRAFADGDAVLQMYPAAFALKQALLSGESFAWTPNILTGFPMAASFVGGFFSPLYQILFKSFSLFTVYHILTTFNFIATSWLTYYLCRLIKLTIPSALFAGIAFPLGTAYWLFGSNLTVTSGFPFIPGLLVATVLLQRFERLTIRIITSFIAGGLLGLVLLGAHPQWPVMAMMMAVIFSIFLDFTNRAPLNLSLKNTNHKSQITNKLQAQNLKFQTTFILNFIIRSLRFVWDLMLEIWYLFTKLTTSLHTTYWILLSFLIGIIISLPQFLASTRIGEFSARGAGIALSSATVGSLLPTDLLSFLLPNLNLPFLIAKPHLLYIGALPLLLALLSFVLPKSKHYRFFFWTFIICLLIGLKYSPVFWIIHQLPIFDAFREPSRFMYIGLFAFTIMAALGFDALVRQTELPQTIVRFTRHLNRAVIALFSCVLAATVAAKLLGHRILAFFTHYFDTHHYASTTRLPLEHYHNVIKTLFDQTVNGITLLDASTAIGIISLLIGSLLVLWYVKKRTENNVIATRSHMLLFSCGIIVLTLLNGIGIKIGTLHTVPQSLITAPPATATIMQSQPNEQPYRVFVFLPGASVYQELDVKFRYDPETNIKVMKELLLSNLSLFSGIDSLDYYDDLMDRRNARLLSYLGSNRGTFGESLAEMEVPFEEKKKLFLERLPLLSMANVKYITSLYPLEHPRLKWNHESRITNHKIPVYLYENLDAMPRYYLTDGVTIYPVLSEKESWKTLLNLKLAIAQNRYTHIECDDCHNDIPPPITPPYEGVALRRAFGERPGTDKGGVKPLVPIIPTFQTNTSYVFNIESYSDQWFIFGQNNLPGWSATIDGKPTEIYRANFLFQTVRIPTGQHVIEWEYDL